VRLNGEATEVSEKVISSASKVIDEKRDLYKRLASI
jgi:hypothetical protein